MVPKYRILFILVLTCSSLQAFATGHFYCSEVPLSVALPTDFPLSIRDLTVSSTTTLTMLNATVRNDSDRPLSQMLLVLELLDNSARLLAAVPIFTVGGDESIISVGINVEDIRTWLDLHSTTSGKGGVLPGRDANISGTSNNTLTRCPKVAQVSAAQLDFAGQAPYRYVGNLNLEPYILYAPQLVLDACRELIPEVIRADLFLQSNGELQKISTHDDLPISLEGCLEQQIRKWRFFPRVVNGRPTPGLLHIVIRLDAREKEESLSTGEQSADVAAFVYGFRAGPGEKHWSLRYGGFPISNRTIKAP